MVTQAEQAQRAKAFSQMSDAEVRQAYPFGVLSDYDIARIREGQSWRIPEKTIFEVAEKTPYVNQGEAVLAMKGNALNSSGLRLDTVSAVRQSGEKLLAEGQIGYNRSGQLVFTKEAGSKLQGQPFGSFIVPVKPLQASTASKPLQAQPLQSRPLNNTFASSQSIQPVQQSRPTPFQQSGISLGQRAVNWISNPVPVSTPSRAKALQAPSSPIGFSKAKLNSMMFTSSKGFDQNNFKKLLWGRK